MNAILIIIDSLRLDHLGCYGNSWIRTPNLDRFANDCVLFTNAYPESLPTVPVRRALHTGMRSYPFRDFLPKKGDPVRLPGWQPIPEDHVTIAEILMERGYRTAFITDTYHLFKPSMNFTRGFSQWELVRGQCVDFYRSSRRDVDVTPHVVPGMKGTGAVNMLQQHLANTRGRVNEEDWFPAQVFLRAAQWLADNKDGGDFFLCVDCFDPHEPWDPPREYRELYDPGYEGKEVILPLYGDCGYLSPQELRHTRALYAAEVTLVDRWFGVFLDKVAQLGLLDTTVIAVIADHGVSLGERGWIGKLPWSLYPELMRIPFMIRHPSGIGKGRRVTSFVYNHDLVPTLFHLLGLEEYTPGAGENLWPLVTGKANSSVHDYVTSAFGDYFWASTQEYCYWSHVSGKDAFLFDLAADPDLRHNIAGIAPEICQRMYRLIEADAGGTMPRYNSDYSPRTFGSRWYMQFQQVLTREPGAMDGPVWNEG